MNPTDALCNAMIDFFDVDTERKQGRYLSQSRVCEMSNEFHFQSMEHISKFQNEKKIDDVSLPIYILKRSTQLAELAWIEAKFPGIFALISENAEYYMLDKESRENKEFMEKWKKNHAERTDMIYKEYKKELES